MCLNFKLNYGNPRSARNFKSDTYSIFNFFFCVCVCQDRNFPNTLIEMRRLAESSQRFRVEDVPPRLHEKERVTHAFREIERALRESHGAGGEGIDRDLHPDALDRSWDQLMGLYQERDQMIQVGGSSSPPPSILRFLSKSLGNSTREIRFLSKQCCQLVFFS